MPSETVPGGPFNVSLTWSQIKTLRLILENTDANLVSCSASTSYDGLSKRISRLQVSELLAALPDKK